ncbi:hypothetical protein SAMN04489724_2199 [Algoriphagus locisalis]|uniref:Uncharacterized protein n=1 Tax=Algoriphagus locisalis TaxID=305507 RepID=A0A1I7ATV4_9BACT|nr:hypothetical protein SAMN04489724_2199 [Algoriphagus locisalis]
MNWKFKQSDSNEDVSGVKVSKYEVFLIMSRLNLLFGS